MIQIDIPDITIKPYVRMTRRGKYVSKQAQQYLVVYFTMKVNK